MAAAPTASDIIGASKLDFPEKGYADATELQPVVDQAVDWLAYVTSRRYSDAQTDSFPEVKSAMDLAVRMRTEQLVLTAQPEILETAADFDLIASFSAGLYSETRRGIGEAVSKGGKGALNPWPALNDLLWMLLGLFPGETNDNVLDRYDYWMALLMGQNAPSWQVVEVDWGRGMGLDAWPWHNVWPDPAGVWDTRIG